MTDLSDKVVAAKDSLLNALGDNTPRYFNFMKLWFRKKWSKEEFDIEARKLLSNEKMHLHNQFLLAILNKIDALRVPQPITDTSSLYSSTTSRNNRKRKRSSRFTLERATFEPYDLFDYLPDENVKLIKEPNYNEDGPPSVPKYCVKEYFLPDIGFIMGRMMIGAWESGLVHVEDAVGECVVLAVQMLLKNIISSVILKRKHYRTTAHGNYFYDVGVEMPDPFVRNSVTRQKIDDRTVEIDKKFGTKRAVDDEIFLSACEQLYPQRKKLITINDVYKVLLLDRNIIGSHSVHSINMERMSQMLH